MCLPIFWKGQMINTMAQAREIIGPDNMIVCGGYPLSAFEGECCLCPLDKEETAKKLGVKTDWSDVDCVVFI